MSEASSERDYTRMIGKCPRLTKEQEYAAWKRGDKELLIRSQLPWAMRIAVTLSRKWKFEDTDAAIEAANLALLRSVEDFRADLGFRLTTFVYRMVYWEVRKEIQIHRQGCGPSIGVTKRLRKPIKLKPLHAENPASDDESPLLTAATSELAADVRAAVASLPEHYRVVVEGRMVGKMLQTIAEEQGVTKQAICQRYQSAVELLRVRLKSHARDLLY